MQSKFAYKSNKELKGSSIYWCKGTLPNTEEIMDGEKFAPRVLIFIWRCLNDAIPVQGIVFKINTNDENSYPICGLDVETIDHIFFICQLAQAVWFGWIITRFMNHSSKKIFLRNGIKNDFTFYQTNSFLDKVHWHCDPFGKPKICSLLKTSLFQQRP